MSADRLASLAFVLAEFKETKTTAAKTPMMAMTTNNSIRVNPLDFTF